MAIDKSLMDEIQNDQANSGSSKIPTWKVPADGKDHVIRILPGFFGKTKKRWYEPLVQHWGPSPDGRGNNVAYPCLKEHFGKECPFCQAWEQAKDSERTIDESFQHCTDENEKERLDNKLKKIRAAVKDLSYRRAYLHNIVDRSENTPTTRAFFAPKTVWDVFVNAFTNNPDGDIFDLEEGHDFSIKRITANNRTSYTCSIKLKPSVLSDDEAEVKRLMKSRVDFPEVYLSEEPSVEDMQKTVDLLLSGANKKRSFQEEDVSPKNRRSDGEDDFRPKKKAPPSDDDDDFRPKKKRVEDDEDDFRPKKKAPPVDDDEDDFRPKKKVEDEKPKRRFSLDDDDAPKPTKSAKDRLLNKFAEDEDE